MSARTTAVLVAAALALAAPRARAQETTPFDLDAACAAARPTPDEALWTLVPWRTSLTDALDEAARTEKPVYLYVNDGEVDTGRC